MKGKLCLRTAAELQKLRPLGLSEREAGVLCWAVSCLPVQLQLWRRRSNNKDESLVKCVGAALSCRAARCGARADGEAKRENLLVDARAPVSSQTQIAHKCWGTLGPYDIETVPSDYSHPFEKFCSCLKNLKPTTSATAECHSRNHAVLGPPHTHPGLHTRLLPLPQADTPLSSSSLRRRLHVLQGRHVAAVDLLQHRLGWALTHVCVCWDGGLAGVVDLAGVHMAQVVRRRHLLQEAVLVPLHRRHAHGDTLSALVWGQRRALGQICASDASICEEVSAV